MPQQHQNQYLNYIIDLSIQGVNKLFVLTFEYRKEKNRAYKILSSKGRNKRFGRNEMNQLDEPMRNNNYLNNFCKL